MKLNPRAFIQGFILDHEGGLSLREADNGNWFDPARLAAGLPQRRGMGKLVGSKYGITAYVLAAHRGLTNVTAKGIASIELSEAVDIGVQTYYLAPGFDKLLWDRVTASIVDKAWLSGPGQAVKLLQRMIGAKDDGRLGPATAQAYASWRKGRSEADAAVQWCEVRKAFDARLNQPENINGWNNRSNSFLPGTKWWIANA
jgi:lysozyme family protein